MTTTTRLVCLRRPVAAAAAAATGAAIVLVALPSTPAAAAVGSVTAANPPAVANTSRATGTGCDAAQQVVQFSHDTPFPDSGERDAATGGPGEGTQVVLVRTDTDGSGSEDRIVGDVVEPPPDAPDLDPKSTKACFRFGPGVDGGAPPANPGRYNVYIYVRDRRAGDMCVGCFSVFSAPPTVTAAVPNELPNGVQGQTFAVHGTNYALSTTVQALYAGTGVVDPTITFTPAIDEFVEGSGVLEGEVDNTATKLSRTIRVDRSAVPGFRDLRVTNSDRQSVTAPAALRITGIDIDRIDPSAAGNSAVQRATVSGRGFAPGSVPSLVDETSATATVIIGSNVARLSDAALVADFDLRNVRPGDYRVRVQAPDGSTSTPECSPVFTVVDTAGGSTGRSTVRSSEFRCGQAAAGGASPSPTASASRSPSPSAPASASPSAAGSPTASATAGASASPSASATPTPSASGSASVAPSASASSGPPTGARYSGLSSPVRVLDTRSNRGSRQSGELVLDLSSRLPADATAAVLNVTVTNASSRGFLVAYPYGTAKPGTSNVNVEAGQTQANEVVVGLSPQRRVSLYVDSMSAHVVVDLVGAMTSGSGGRITTNAPVRAFDSRNTGVPRRSGEVVVDLSGRIPAGATDAVLNVTVTAPSARGFVTVFPTGTSRPPTSNVNFERGQTQANEVMTRVGTGSNAGRVSLFVDSAAAAVVVDVVGAVTASGGQVFTALERPTRALDTRDGRGPRRSGDVRVTMPSAVPPGATGVVLNVTATNGTRAGFVTVFPAGSSNPGTSNVNFPGERRATATTPASAGTQANEVISGLGDDRRVTLFIGGAGAPAAHVIVDVVGYLSP